jgi:hypothetical protein
LPWGNLEWLKALLNRSNNLPFLKGKFLFQYCRFVLFPAALAKLSFLDDG